MDLEQSVLKRIVPTPEQVSSIQGKADRLKGMVEEYVRARGIDVEARFAGSFSKNTYLSDPDLDMFLMFPPEIDPEDLTRTPAGSSRGSTWTWSRATVWTAPST